MGQSKGVIKERFFEGIIYTVVCKIKAKQEGIIMCF
jgi:hypothetical protein